MNFEELTLILSLNKCLFFTNLNEEDECSILLKKYKYGYKLPCNHSFSLEGIIEWFNSDNTTCPMCRMCVIHREIHD